MTFDHSNEHHNVFIFGVGFPMTQHVVFILKCHGGITGVADQLQTIADGRALLERVLPEDRDIFKELFMNNDSGDEFGGFEDVTSEPRPTNIPQLSSVITIKSEAYGMILSLRAS